MKTIGSFNDGDNSTTNLYIGNVNPTVNENDLCDVFAAFGPLASVKIMWPRTDEERARNRNSGFVAYMNRQDAEIALKSLDGIRIKDYEIKLGWAKQVTIPAVPIALPDPIRMGYVQAMILSKMEARQAFDASKPIPVSQAFKSTKQDEVRMKGKLDKKEIEQLGSLLSNITTKRKSIGETMLFCINHSEAASDVIEYIYNSICKESEIDADIKESSSSFKQKLAKIFLISDILHNCSAQVTNSSYYRGGFKSKLINIFENIAKELVKINDRKESLCMKDGIMSIFKAWKDWTLYEDDFLFNLSGIALGLEASDRQSRGIDKHSDDMDKGLDNLKSTDNDKMSIEDIDGSIISDEQFKEFLEFKGLTLSWYQSLGLDKGDDAIKQEHIDKNDIQCEKRNNHPDDCVRLDQVDGIEQKVQQDKAENTNSNPRNDTELWKSKRAAFKTTKWDTIDPDEVAEQVVTLSKLSNECEVTKTSTEQTDDELDALPVAKKPKIDEN